MRELFLIFFSLVAAYTIFLLLSITFITWGWPDIPAWSPQWRLGFLLVWLMGVLASLRVAIDASGG